MYDVVQILGSLFILTPFVAVAFGRLTATSYLYLSLNAGGSSALAATAVIGHEWGFVLLEAVWALVSLHSLARKARGSAAVSGIR